MSESQTTEISFVNIECHSTCVSMQISRGKDKVLVSV